MARKPKAPKAVILPPELDDDSEEEHGSVIPDDDGWITLEGDNGPVAEGSTNPIGSDSGTNKKLARGFARRRKGRSRRDS